ncbi:toxin-antitoxin system YwqK family antitoxin [Chitinimonas lacunae]|uniref:Toxin-antitoxin system YwqK family antitoxin n=1 Tax=Chitinimonas lacunae TaxID=1963018 RepID=A0ABV8MKU4_9NEIS
MIEKSCERIQEDFLEADGELVIHNGKPFTGFGFDPFPNGHGVEYETEYRNGLPHGLKRKWYESGQLEYEISCINGVKHGEERHWFASGAIKLIANYEYGVKIESKAWSDDGELVGEFIISPSSANFSLLQKRREKGWNVSSLE